MPDRGDGEANIADLGLPATFVLLGPGEVEPVRENGLLRRCDMLYMHSTQ